MAELMTLHEHLDDAIKLLRKALDTTEKRQFFVSEDLLRKTIAEIDTLEVHLRKFI